MYDSCSVKPVLRRHSVSPTRQVSPQCRCITLLKLNYLHRKCRHRDSCPLITGFNVYSCIMINCYISFENNLFNINIGNYSNLKSLHVFSLCKTCGILFITLFIFRSNGVRNSGTASCNDRATNGSAIVSEPLHQPLHLFILLYITYMYYVYCTIVYYFYCVMEIQ